jgi:hypothetical protein
VQGEARFLPIGNLAGHIDSNQNALFVKHPPVEGRSGLRKSCITGWLAHIKAVYSVVNNLQVNYKLKWSLSYPFSMPTKTSIMLHCPLELCAMMQRTFKQLKHHWSERHAN